MGLCSGFQERSGLVGMVGLGQRLDLILEVFPQLNDSAIISSENDQILNYQNSQSTNWLDSLSNWCLDRFYQDKLIIISTLKFKPFTPRVLNSLGAWNPKSSQITELPFQQPLPPVKGKKIIFLPPLSLLTLKTCLHLLVGFYITF